jgi:hypothetical protein
MKIFPGPLHESPIMLHNPSTHSFDLVADTAKSTRGPTGPKMNQALFPMSVGGSVCVLFGGNPYENT